jgi:hypothetical protein
MTRKLFGKAICLQMFEEGLERLLEVCLSDAFCQLKQAVQYCWTIV